MNQYLRWAKFNLVGIFGTGVQLSTLALFNRWLRGHYLIASAAAIELTLLHNFVWHIHYTWRDRRNHTARLGQLIRFHLSNGLVSIFGNLVLMSLLVRHAHLPLLVSNLIAIVCCSVANFFLGNNWAFARSRKEDPMPRCETFRAASPQSLTLLIVVVAGAATVHAQAPETPPTVDTAPVDAPAPQPRPAPANWPSQSDGYIYRIGAICGAGASTSAAGTKPTIGCGVGMTLVPLPVFLEVGMMGPQANRSSFSGYISLDGSIALAPSSSKYLPMAIIGYSRLFETGHAFDYGLALALPRFGKHKDDASSLRIELRDYWTFASPNQHNVMLRLGWMSQETD